MEGSSSQPSSSPLANLLCREDKSCLNEEDELKLGTQFLHSQVIPYYNDLDYEDDDYIQMLVQKERISLSDSSSNYPSWVKNARTRAINWILNEHQTWAAILLSVACVSLAAKMEESKVPALSEYKVEDLSVVLV
ncbi:Cyclin-D5-1 [Bienertia sinuspersici]